MNYQSNCLTHWEKKVHVARLENYDKQPWHLSLIDSVINTSVCDICRSVSHSIASVKFAFPSLCSEMLSCSTYPSQDPHNIMDSLNSKSHASNITKLSGMQFSKYLHFILIHTPFFFLKGSCLFNCLKILPTFYFFILLFVINQFIIYFCLYLSTLSICLFIYSYLSFLLPYSEAPKCVRCSMMIYDATLVSYSDKFWHKSCFRCLLCQKEVNDACFTNGKEIYCSDDFNRWVNFPN